MDDSYKQTLDEAYNLHVSGKYEEALTLYEMLLEEHSDDADLLNLYAQLNFALKNFDKALSAFNKVFELTKLPDIKLNIIKTLLAKGDCFKAISVISQADIDNDLKNKYLAIAHTNAENYKEAAVFYEKLVASGSADASDKFNLSVCYFKSNNTEKALECVLPLFEAYPSDTSIILHIASLYQKLSDDNNEIKFLSKAFELTDNIDILFRIGLLYKKNDNDEKALECFSVVLERRSDYNNALYNIALIYKKHDKNIALSLFEDLYEKDSTNEKVVFHLYSLNAEMFNYEKALFWAEKYIELQTDSDSGYIMYADICLAMLNFADAEKYYVKARDVSKEPDIYVITQLAYIYSLTGRTDAAVQMLEKHKDNIRAREDLTRIYLKNKQFQKAREGFFDLHVKITDVEEKCNRAKSALYRLNLLKKANINEELFNENKPKIFDLTALYLPKIWKGQDIAHKKVLLYSAHGIGDLIMCARFISDVKALKPEQIILQLPASVIDLFEYNYPGIKIYNKDDKVPESEFDYALPIFVLPYNVSEDFSDIPYSRGYLSVSDDKVLEASKHNFFNTDKKKIGIYYSGNPTVMKSRSVKLKYFLPLLDLPDIKFYSFQVASLDGESEELKSKLPIIDLEPYINNYEDTAALLKNIDVLITIDTSIVHLAGALGIKTYLLLPYDSEWRWFSDLEKTPWYDSVRIFKQTTPGDWEEVMRRVKNELSI